MASYLTYCMWYIAKCAELLTNHARFDVFSIQDWLFVINILNLYMIIFWLVKDTYFGSIVHDIIIVCWVLFTMLDMCQAAFLWSPIQFVKYFFLRFVFIVMENVVDNVAVAFNGETIIS